MPHLHCYLGDPWLVWTMVSTDLLIGFAYLGISLTLWALIRRNRVSFSLVVVCFGVFIGACGATHFMEVWTVWNPNYWFAAAIKVVTAIASVGTGIYLFRLRQALNEFAEAARVSNDRKLSLEAATRELEDRVASRTAELENLDARFQRVSKATNLGVWYCDLKSGNLIWNDNTKEHFWLPPEMRVKDEDFFEHILPGDRETTRRAIAQAIDLRMPYDIVYRTIDPKHPEVCKHIRAIGWTSYEETGKPIRFDGITLDITKEIEANEQLLAAKESAEAANRAKTQFLANMSHEIRTPIGAIMGFAQMLRNESSTTSDKNDFVKIIERNSENLLRLIDDILDLSKVEAGKITLENTTFSLPEFLGDLWAAFSLRCASKDLIFSTELETSIPDLICLDQLRLRQILLNVIGNSLKFTELGEIKINVRFVDAKLEIEVTDTGPGIQTTNQEKLFQPFGQADPSMTRKFGGSGLGLVLSRRLCHLLGGDLVLIKSKIGEGSTFQVSITPALAAGGRMFPKDAKLPISSPGTNVQEPKPTLHGLKILLVEDSPDNRTLIAIYLRSTGALLDMAEDGLEGVNKALTNAPDIVLMDIQMPLLDGYAATKKLRASGFSKPIIALTAHAMREERDRCFEVGCTDYLTKPIQRERLIEVLTRLYSTLR